MKTFTLTTKSSRSKEKKNYEDKNTKFLVVTSLWDTQFNLRCNYFKTVCCFTSGNVPSREYMRERNTECMHKGPNMIETS